MITHRTTLVLGAGASIDFGFPSGYELVRRICNELHDGQPLSNLLSTLGYDGQEAIEFVRALRESGWLSVDTFLEHRPELLEIGKAAVAAVLIPCESHDALFRRDQSGPTWYDLLFQMLRAPRSEWAANALKIITFNYDRSLEEYLATALQAAYGLKGTEVAELLRSIPIHHVHGQLGEHPFWSTDTSRAYSTDLSTASVGLAASGIRVVHEGADDDPVFSRARQALSQAERIAFLGFGYHADNIRRLGVRDLSSPNWILGSSVGMTHTERSRAAARFDNRITIDNRGIDLRLYLRDPLILDD